MEPAEWVLVLMIVGYVEAGDLVEQVRVIAPTHECHAIRHAASRFNAEHSPSSAEQEKEIDRKIWVMCLEHPDNRSA